MTTKDSTIVGNKEILLVADTIAHEKGINTSDVINALEEGIRLAARKKYGYDLTIECIIDRKTGKISLFNRLDIVEKERELEPDFNHKKEVILADAKKLVKAGKAFAGKEDEELAVGGFIRTELPPIDLSRVVVQVAKNEIIKRVKDAERDKEYNEFINRVGTIINGLVKKIGLRNIVVDVDGYEALLTMEGMIPGERFKVGDRIRAYIEEVKKETKGAQIFLSRTHNNFMLELFKQEVPEIYDGVIEIKAIARDPGSKAKIAIYSRDESSDIVGATVGVRGARVQAVSSELKGEKIDVIRWSDNLAELVASALTPAKVSKVVVKEVATGEEIDAIVTQDQLSLAIGRGGQNVRLASKIVSMRVNVMTEEDEKKKRVNEFNETTALFIEALDVEEVIALLLASDGYTNVESIANASIEDLKTIEGFDDDIALEIKKRAEDWLEENNENIETE